MSDRHVISIYSPAQLLKAHEGMGWLKDKIGQGWWVTFTRRRSDAQNNLMWKWLGIISKELLWNGQYWPDTSWKDCLMHAFAGGQFMPGIDGSHVPIGKSTSSLGKAEFSLFMDSIDAFAAREGVELPKPEDKQ